MKAKAHTSKFGHSASPASTSTPGHLLAICWAAGGHCTAAGFGLFAAMMHSVRMAVPCA